MNLAKTLVALSSLQVNHLLLNGLMEQFITLSPSLLTRYMSFSDYNVSGSDKKFNLEHQDVCDVIMSALNTGQYMTGTHTHVFSVILNVVLCDTKYVGYQGYSAQRKINKRDIQ